jgi:organic hydroperoxide reductase OsmC/OhrA
MVRTHRYTASVSWKGNLGAGTLSYQGYSRDHEIAVEGKQVILGSSDANFRGDKSRLTPEDLLVSSLSACHMLWYLHLCAINDVVVISYSDEAEGEMSENADGSGQFTKVILHPRVTVREQTMVGKAESLHLEASQMCFIARSVNFPVRHVPEIFVYEKSNRLDPQL